MLVEVLKIAFSIRKLLKLGNFQCRKLVFFVILKVWKLLKEYENKGMKIIQGNTVVSFDYIGYPRCFAGTSDL